MDMMVAILFLLGLASLTMSTPALNRSNKKTKRIAFGTPVPSLNTYELYHFVQIRQSWACLSDQTDHEGSLGSCQMDDNKCGGTLIHPEFVLTAAHCLMYWEVYVTNKDDDDADQDAWVILAKEDMGALDEWKKKVRLTFEGVFVMPKPKHTVYSEWALLMGSHDSNRMKQKRHAVKAFPHGIYPKNILTEDEQLALEEELNSWHDVALVRACQPFNIKRREVELVPMLKSEVGLKNQFTKIVTEGRVCLYVGFGAQDNDALEAFNSGYPRFPPNLMLHTWRHSVCSSSCNRDLLNDPSTEHTCVMCSRHLGTVLGVSETGDSGSPVTCEGLFVATFTRAALVVSRNVTRADSYPLHCIIKAISPKNLEYYRKVPYGTGYHPLQNTRLRRFPFPNE